MRVTVFVSFLWVLFWAEKIALILKRNMHPTHFFASLLFRITYLVSNTKKRVYTFSCLLCHFPFAGSGFLLSFPLKHTLVMSLKWTVPETVSPFIIFLMLWSCLFNAFSNNVSKKVHFTYMCHCYTRKIRKMNVLCGKRSECNNNSSCSFTHVCK